MAQCAPGGHLTGAERTLPGTFLRGGGRAGFPDADRKPLLRAGSRRSGWFRVRCVGGGDEFRVALAVPLPPFFTLQPNVDTRQKQMTAWCSLVLYYCRLNKQYTMTVMEAQESPLFNNRKLQRKLPMESIQIVLEELRKKGNLEWLDKNKSSFLIMWRRPEEWGKLIYQWVSKNGLTNSVFTLYELSNGDDTENEEFHGLEESMLLRALQVLQQEHRAEIITLDDGRGVKFF
ncbi:vacuolar protein-sorting-associated protein 25 [Emydura macquarii macquarii]|uniref:vacuolar protein-sorting-associated protein 25 n=1 Tax=Emydura macquarii macquarii TaxID=1129001 RepID=UPI00352B11BA